MEAEQRAIAFGVVAGALVILGGLAAEIDLMRLAVSLWVVAVAGGFVALFSAASACD